MSLYDTMLSQRAAGLDAPTLKLKSAKEYYRLTKPGIVYSNVMTAAAGYLLTTKDRPRISTFIALLLGTALIIAAACVLNNVIDRGIDAKMKRTKTRALASGSVKPHSAVLYASILGVLGFIILTKTNLVTFLIGAGAIFSYVALYGIAKRKTKHGTLIGTFPGAAALVAGYTAASGRLSIEALILFLIMMSWQMAHFYAIAIFRLSDYRAAGLPVMPAVVGIKKTKFQILAYILLFMASTLALGLSGYGGKVYTAAIVLLGVYWFYQGSKGFNKIDSVRWARKMFGLSLVVLLGLSLLMGINGILP